MTRFLIALCLTTVLLPGCEKQKKVTRATNGSDAGQSSGGSGASGGGGGGGAGGGVMAPLKAAKNVIDANDMRNIHLFIETASLASGSMPSPQMVYDAIRMESPKLAAKIDDGSITLCSPTNREEIWAYETAALENGGWACSSGGPVKMDAAALKQKLGK